MSDQYKTFNKALKDLIDIISNELPKDSLLDDIKRKYTAAITTDRTILLTEVGKELFAYRDYIAESRWEELIEKDWTTDLEIDVSSIQNIVMTLRKIWSEYSSEEKKKVKKLIKTMLSEYTKYLMSNQ